MTAEVAILNRGAVALAADSAVTVTNGSGRKVYNTVNKLFGLSSTAPVGVMIWGGADLCGIPWEVMIKEYRSELGSTTFGTLEEYCADLQRFLNGSPFITDALQRQSIRGTAYSIFLSLIVGPIEQRVHDHFEDHGTISRAQVAGIITSVLNAQKSQLESYDLVDGFASRDVGRLIGRYGAEIDVAMEAAFENLPLGKASQAKVRRIFGLSCCRGYRSRNTSGLVVAGFGENDIFPKVASFEIEGYWLDRLKLFDTGVRATGPDNPAIVKPFAQQEMVSLFMEGVDPGYKRVVSDALAGVLGQLPDLVADQIGANGTQRSKLVAGLSKSGGQLMATFLDALDEQSHQAHVSPIIEAVAALPRDELGAMAESLVNLTSFKRRVTLAEETVGGAIDVAVISKGDGLIWLQRKHYFEMDKNPQFAARYG